MPQPTGDIIEVTLIGTQNNQEVTNVLHFERLDAGETAEDIATAAGAKFVTTMLPNMAEEYVFTAINYRNLFNPSEAGTVDVTNQPGGRISVDPLPPHDTVSLSLIHDEPQIRKGRKSIAGMAEDQQDNGVITPAVVTAIQSDSLDWMTEALKDVATGLVDTAQPVIVKRIAEVVEGVTGYRLPGNATEALVGWVYDVVVSAYIRTQNSRKIGRGS